MLGWNVERTNQRGPDIKPMFLLMFSDNPDVYGGSKLF